MERYEKIGKTFDFVALLEPTSPLRADQDLTKAIIKMIDNNEADSLVSVGEVHMEHPMIIKKINKEGFVVPYIENTTAIYQRQQADTAYFPYGVVYICKVEIYKELKTFYTRRTIPFIIERWQNFEIDDQVDFSLTEYVKKLKSKQLL